MHRLMHIGCIAGLRAWHNTSTYKAALQLTHPLLGAGADSSGKPAMRAEEVGTSVFWPSADRLRGCSPPWCVALPAQPAQPNAVSGACLVGREGSSAACNQPQVEVRFTCLLHMLLAQMPSLQRLSLSLTHQTEHALSTWCPCVKQPTGCCLTTQGPAWGDGPRTR